MKKANINGTELEYEVEGLGEPVLLIGTGPIADSFLPLCLSGALREHYQLVRYRQRRKDNGPSGEPISFDDHAEDAAALLAHLGIDRAHVAGHSTGGAIALQMALNHPNSVATLVLFEPPLLSVPSAPRFFENVGPALAAYERGERSEAMAQFLSAVCSLEWEECRSVIDACVPDGAETALANADNFFGSYLPALSAWTFGIEQAPAVRLPALSVQGTESEPLFKDSCQQLQAWVPQLEVCVVEGAAHLLHMQRPVPVIEGVSGFLGRHPIAS